MPHDRSATVPVHLRGYAGDVLRPHDLSTVVSRRFDRQARAVSRTMRRSLRRRFGIWPLYEIRNQLVLGPRSLAMRRREAQEVSRLTLQLGVRPTADVAVIVPTFRRPDQLLRAVSSVLGQTYQDMVVIVVSDGAAEALPALPDDPRLSVVALGRNTGVLGLVRNVGIRLTSSRYVAFLDDDNRWLPNHLSAALSGMTEGVDAVYTAVRRVDASGAVVDVLSNPFDRRRLADESYIDANSIVVRRRTATFFSRIRRGKNVLPPEDWEYIYRLSRRYRVDHVPLETVEYLINPGSYYSDWSRSPLSRAATPAIE